MAPHTLNIGMLLYILYISGPIQYVAMLQVCCVY
jgi:hypothetical protein